jgi:hypothetical protein
MGAKLKEFVQGATYLLCWAVIMFAVINFTASVVM